MFVGKTVDVL